MDSKKTKPARTKLHFERETLKSLTPEELERVRGGNDDGDECDPTLWPGRTVCTCQFTCCGV